MDVEEEDPQQNQEAERVKACARTCKRFCTSSLASSEQSTLAAFGLRINRTSGRKTIVRAPPLTGQVFVWIAYFYVIISTVWFGAGPISNAWVPQYGVYVTYPFAVMVGAYISFIWTHQPLMLWFEVLAGLCAFVVNFCAVLQSMNFLLTTGGINLAYDGNSIYTPLSGSFNQFAVLLLLPGYSKPFWFLQGQIAFFWANTVFSLTGALMAARVLWAIRGVELHPDDRMPLCPRPSEVISTSRLALTWLSILVMLVYLLGYLVISAWQSQAGYIILTLFPNATNSLLLMMMTISIFPPLGDNSRPKYVKDHEDDEKVERYRAGIGSKSLHFIAGWIIALFSSIIFIVNNAGWRRLNSMGFRSGVCGDFKPFLGVPGTPGTAGAVINFFHWQNITYTPLKGTLDLVSQSNDWTCADDAANLFLISFGFILFVIGMVVVVGAVNSPEDKELQTATKVKTRTELVGGRKNHAGALAEVRSETEKEKSRFSTWTLHKRSLAAHEADLPLPGTVR